MSASIHTADRTYPIAYSAIFGIAPKNVWHQSVVVLQVPFAGGGSDTAPVLKSLNQSHVHVCKPGTLGLHSMIVQFAHTYMIAHMHTSMYCIHDTRVLVRIKDVTLTYCVSSIDHQPVIHDCCRSHTCLKTTSHIPVIDVGHLGT